MRSVRKKWLPVAALLAGQLALNGCQPQSETVTPNQSIASATRQQASASDWTTINADTWTVSTKTPRTHMAGFVDNAVTNAVVEQGLVVAFYRDPVTGTVHSLPATLRERSLSFTYYAMRDKGIISFQEEAAKPLAGDYRWVVVPKDAATGVNWNDYAAVRAALHLAE